MSVYREHHRSLFSSSRALCMCRESVVPSWHQHVHWHQDRTAAPLLSARPALATRHRQSADYSTAKIVTCLPPQDFCGVEIVKINTLKYQIKGAPFKQGHFFLVFGRGLKTTKMKKKGKQCFQRWNRCVRFKVVRLSSSIPWDLRHAEQLLFLFPCSNLTVYWGSFLPTLYVPLYHVYSTASHLAIRSQTMLTGIILYYLVT